MRPGSHDRPHPVRTRRPGAAAGLAACALAAGVTVATTARAAPLAPVAFPARAPAAPVAAPVSAQVETPGGAIVVRDPVDTAGGFDLTRVQLGRAADGRLRAALTLAAPWRMRDLPGDDGPPGSLCLRMWTLTKGPGTFPDRLLCISSDARGRHMRGSVLVERAGALQRVAGATLARSSDRTVVARFSQSAIGRPASVRFAGEATPPGCPRVACIDTAPNAPTVATLTLRSN
jgi:hypothetical protein